MDLHVHMCICIAGYIIGQIWGMPNFSFIVVVLLIF